jgi:hypothetical protein
MGSRENVDTSSAALNRSWLSRTHPRKRAKKATSEERESQGDHDMSRDIPLRAISSAVSSLDPGQDKLGGVCAGDLAEYLDTARCLFALRTLICLCLITPANYHRYGIAVACG